MSATKTPTKPKAKKADKKPTAEKKPVTPALPAPAEPKIPKLVEKTSIEIKKLKLDAGTQPREATDESKVQEYADIITDAKKEGRGNPFHDSPIELIRTAEGKLVPWDGFHRIFAHKSAGEHEIVANIREGTEETAILLSVGANAAHGLQRSNKDKKRAVKIVLSNPEWAKWSDVVIARICGVSTWLVADSRTSKSSPTTRVSTRGGKQVEVKTAKIGKKEGKSEKSEKSEKPAEKQAPEPTFIEKFVREITKVENAIADAHGKDEAKKFTKGIEDGSLPLNAAKLKEFSGLTPNTIGKIWPLVKGGTDPWKAYEFAKSEISDKVIQDLHNRCLANGGTFEHKSGGFTITVVKNK